MFIPKIFEIKDKSVIDDFIKNNSFVTLISMVDGKLWATHIPMLMVTNQAGLEVLQGHVSKANPQWKTIDGQEVLVIFQGAHTFITADWYDHQNVSTWNYMTVHIYGKARLVEGEQLYDMIQHLTNTYESEHSKARLENLDKDFVKKEMRGIMGIEVIIDRKEAKFKLSQNRNDVNYQRIIDALDSSGNENDRQVAEAMRNMKEKN